jgi:hypothetical protein
MATGDNAKVGLGWVVSSLLTPCSFVCLDITKSGPTPPAQRPCRHLRQSTPSDLASLLNDNGVRLLVSRPENANVGCARGHENTAFFIVASAPPPLAGRRCGRSGNWCRRNGQRADPETAGCLGQRYAAQDRLSAQPRKRGVSGGNIQFPQRHVKNMSTTSPSRW